MSDRGCYEGGLATEESWPAERERNAQMPRLWRGSRAELDLIVLGLPRQQRRAFKSTATIKAGKIR